MGSCSSEKMKGGHLLIVTVLGFLALTDGGHLFGKGLVKGAFSSLFKREKEPQHCEIKWEDVWKPHCTTTYEKVCKQEPKKECCTEHEEKCETEWVSECKTEYHKQCQTEWVEECWEEDEEICEWLQDSHEPQEHHYSHEPKEPHYSSKPSSHGNHESATSTAQAGNPTKRSADHHHEHDDDDALEELDEKTLTEALENIPASELLKLSQEIERDTEAGVATLGDGSSRQKRSIHLLNLHLLGKHLLGKGLLARAGKGLLGKALGTKVGGKKVQAKASTVKHTSSHSSSHKSHHKKCKNVKKCWWKPVKKCQESPVDSCWDEPRESCVDVPNKRCWSEPKELCKKYPEEKCWETYHESCWDEPREHCTEKKIKVAKKWCVEHEKPEENAFDKIKNLF